MSSNELFSVSKPSAKDGVGFQIIQCSSGAWLDSTMATELGVVLAEIQVQIAIVDLTQSVFISSAALRELVSTTKRRRKESVPQDLVVVAPRGSRSREVIDLAGVGSIFYVYETLEKALGSL